MECVVKPLLVKRCAQVAIVRAIRLGAAPLFTLRHKVSCQGLAKNGLIAMHAWFWNLACRSKMTGGLGADMFMFDTAPISTATADSIVDFSGLEGDKIQLSASVFGALGSAGDAVTLSGANLTYNAATGALIYDADGAGGAAGITIAILGTRPALVDSDLELIA